MSQMIGVNAVFAREGDMSAQCPVCGNRCGLDYTRRTLRTHWADEKKKTQYCELSESKVTILDPGLDPAKISARRSRKAEHQAARDKGSKKQTSTGRKRDLQKTRAASERTSEREPSSTPQKSVKVRKSERKLQQEAAAALEQRKRETKPIAREGMVTVWTESPETGEMEWVQLTPIEVHARGVCQCPFCGMTVNIDLRGCRLHGHQALIQGKERKCPASNERFAFVNRFGQEIGKDLPPEQKHLALSNMSQGTDRVLKKKRAPMTEEQRARRIANRRRRNMEKMTMYADSPYFDEEKYQVSENSVNALPGGLYGSNRRH